jgi:hypothetical protein
MQIIIEIPNSEIPKQQDIIEIPLHFMDGKVCEAGGYGFDVLPKGHGRLIDEKDLSLMTVHLVDGIFVCDAPTIIEADKAESEDVEVVHG